MHHPALPGRNPNQHRLSHPCLISPVFVFPYNAKVLCLCYSLSRGCPPEACPTASANRLRPLRHPFAAAISSVCHRFRGVPALRPGAGATYGDGRADSRSGLGGCRDAACGERADAGAECGFPPAQLFPAVALVVAGKRQGRVPEPGAGARGIRPRGALAYSGHAAALRHRAPGLCGAGAPSGLHALQRLPQGPLRLPVLRLPGCRRRT